MAQTPHPMMIDDTLETLQSAIERLTQLAEDEGDSSLAWQAENALRQVRETLRDAVLLPSLEAIEEILSGIPVPPPILPVWEDLLPSTWEDWNSEWEDWNREGGTG